MKILLVGDCCEGAGAWFINNNLKQHDVSIFDYRKLNLPFHSRSLINKGLRHFARKPFSKYMNFELEKAVKKEAPDVVFVVKGELILPNILDKLKETGVKTINWYVDPIVSFVQEKALDFAGHYDIFYTKDRDTVNVLNLAGLKNAKYLPDGFDETKYVPKKLTPKEEKEYGSDASLVGFQYNYRLMTFSNMSLDKFKMWGEVNGNIERHPELKRYINNRFVSVDEKNLIFNATKVNINLHHPGEVDSANLRLFEICGSGGFQIVDYKREIETLFKVGKEVVCFKDNKEMKEIIDYYLDNEEERKEIALAGKIRAWKEHKLSDRLKIIMNDLKKLV